VRRLWPGPAPSVDLVTEYAHPPGRHVRANMIASVDGAATLTGVTGGLGGAADRELFMILRTVSDVVLVGAGTVRAESYGPVRDVAERRRIRLQLGLSPVPCLAVVSARLDLDPAAEIFVAARPRTLVITTGQADGQRRKALEQVADVLACGQQQVDLALALDLLAQRGLAHVLCEGGPALLGQLAGAGLLDELCLTISPRLVGPGPDRVIAGPEHAWPELRQVRPAALLLDDEGFLFARYTRES
jgi:riboflavin biosynthesis pyrimidine reductase